MGTVLFFSGQSQNNVMTNRLRLDAAILAEQGHAVSIADLAEPLELPVPSQVDLVVGYQGWGLDVALPSGRKYVEETGCPYVVVLGDHPIHHAQRILSCPPGTVFCVSSRNQATFLEKIFGVQTMVRLLPSVLSGPVHNVGGEKDIDAILVGQSKTPEAFLDEHDLPATIREIVKELVRRSSGSPSEDPVLTYMQHGFEPVMSIVGNQLTALNVGRIVDLAVRHDFRSRYVNALRTLPVTFVGDDWVSMTRRDDDAFVALPSVPYVDLPALYGRSKICLNLHPPHFDFHERILDGMKAKAAVATVQTDWLSDSFTFGEDLLALPADVTDVPDWYHRVLSQPEKLEMIGERGHQIARSQFGCDVPAALFADILNSQAAA